MNSNITIQSSENESLKGDMSYLYGRDPSILTYGQRPFPSQESKKNLISLLEDTREKNDSVESTEKTTTSVDSSPMQTIKVFLRMKPFPHKMKLSSELLEAYTILNSNTLLTKMASLDNNTSCLKKIKNSDKIYRKFIFTQTFDSNTSQLQLFELAVKPQMIDFLDGKNSIIMSYGTTNSGKTYTLQGTADSPGIIPRAIEFVFSNICPRDTALYKPINLCDIVHLSTQDYIHEMDLKTQLLAFNTTEKHYHINTFKHMQQLLHEESPIRPSCKYDAHYSVWISFAEIYNETIYDLLWNDCQKKRPALKLAIDSKGRTFIKGLKSICVNSGVEAYQVLMAGQYNLKVAATALNSRSSRSHCIFTIKLLKYRIEQDPQSVVVSTFAFCDLAGSERLKKTLNVGDRLKEAQNINTSLLVLGRCLKTIYESQCSSKHKIDSIGPFRESKLTRLFQRALSGKEQIALVVNVNPVPNLYVETQNVLNFSAIAKKIVIERTEMIKHSRRSQTRFSRLVTQNMKVDMDWENTELEDVTEASKDSSTQDTDIEEKDEEVFEELLNENESLKKEIKELKSSALKRDMQTRQEMANMYSDMIKDLEAHWKNRLINMEEQQEDLRELAVEHIEHFYKEKLKQCNHHKRSRSSIDDQDEDYNEKIIQDLEEENTHLLAKIEILKKSIRDLKQSKDVTESEKSKAYFELAVAKDEAKRTNEMFVALQKSIDNGQDTTANFIDELQNMIKIRDERIKKMKIFLNEAKEEYISITEQAQKLENDKKKKDEILVEKNEHILDLEEQMNQANIYSAEQNKLIEKLEEDIDHQTKKLVAAEKEVVNLSNELSLLTSSKNNLSDNHNDDINKEFENLNSHYKDLKISFELLAEENNELKEKLTKKTNEIHSLEDNLHLTKNKLHEITDKVNSLSIEDSPQKLLKEKKHTYLTADQASQTEIDEIVKKECLERISSFSCQKFEVENLNSSCQTSIIENPITEMHEKSLQTSFNNLFDNNQGSSHSDEEVQQQLKEIIEELKTCKAEKIEDQNKFEKITNDMKNQITALLIKEKEKEERILSLQQDLDTIVKSTEEEKNNLKSLIETSEINDKKLMDQITHLLVQEQDKDKEISSLQTEMKNLIQSNDETVQIMETQLKNVLKDLTSSKDQLLQAEEKYKKLEKDYKKVINILEIKSDNLEKKILDKQTENGQLLLKIEELTKNLHVVQHELEVFKKNRDETVFKYDDLVKSLCKDLEHERKEIARLQNVISEVKENTGQASHKKCKKKMYSCIREKKDKEQITIGTTENTSDDNCSTKAGTENLKKLFLTPCQDNIPVIELSESESNSIKEPASNSRKTRRKKLFTPLDESYVDIEQSGEPSPSPSSCTRSLRNRRR